MNGLNKSVEYNVRPVLNDKDYEKAMLVYDKKLKEYEQNIAARLANDKANKAAHIKDSISNAQIDRDNAKTAQSNKIIEARNAQIEKMNAEIALQTEKWNKEILSINKNEGLLRNFEIEGFGIWNCDKPVPIENLVTVEPEFVNSKGEKIDIYTANLFVRKVNGLLTLSGNKIQIPRNQESMIVGATEDRFVYITYDEMKQLSITPETKKVTFPMHIVSKENNNYAFIRSLVKQ
jgi:hypothetical protein